MFGNGGSGGDPNTVYFTDGLNSERDGLLGAIDAVPEPGTLLIFAGGLLGLMGLRQCGRSKS